VSEVPDVGDDIGDPALKGLARYIALANTIVLVRRLLRRAWILYRWDTRPSRRP
jgi:hypothetical protein